MKNALALGTFDGVHKGHRAVLNMPDGYVKNAVIFSEPPKMLISGDKELIMTVEDKCRILKSVGIENIDMLDFCKVRNMTAEDFLCFLKKRYSPSYISCGYNYRFGRGASGNSDLLKRFCRENGITLNCCEPVTENGVLISSTLIRNMLKNGEIAAANSLLSEDFSYCGKVIKGDMRGRTLGFPTINQRYPEDLVKLKFGVYKTKVCIDGTCFDGITDIGVRPTYPTDYCLSETNIIGFEGDIYGRTVRIFPQRFLRKEKKFSSLSELKRQIEKDKNS